MENFNITSQRYYSFFIFLHCCNILKVLVLPNYYYTKQKKKKKKLNMISNVLAMF